jgi:hypothetical protein
MKVKVAINANLNIFLVSIVIRVDIKNYFLSLGNPINLRHKKGLQANGCSPF